MSTGLEDWQKIVIGAILTSIVWIFATFITPPDNEETLKNFLKHKKWILDHKKPKIEALENLL